MSKVLLALIDPPAWNSRTTKTGAALKREDEKIAELSESLKSEGQLQPIEVEDNGGRYELVIGSRRVRAAKMLQWTDLEANIRPSSSAGARIVRNVVENEQRENLTTYEQARAYAQLRDIGLKNAEIGTKLSKSQQHVSNLANAYERLPEPILAEWQKQHSVATFDNLRELSNTDVYKTPEAQVRAWDNKVAEAAKLAAAGQKPGKRGKGKKEGNKGGGSMSYGMVKKNVDLAIDLLTPRGVAADKIGGTKQWASQLVHWLIGQRKTPPDGIEFPAKPEK